MKIQVISEKWPFLKSTEVWCLIFLSLAIFLLTYLAPVSYSGSDPKFTLLVSQSILDNGTIRLDSYQNDLLLGSPIQQHIDNGFIHKHNDHYYNYFPLGPSILTLPIIGATSALGYDMRQVDDSFLVQRVLASITSLAVVWIVYWIARAYLPPTPSIVIAAVLVLGSGFVSTMGTALWSINFSVVFMGLSLLFVVRYDTGASKTVHPVLLGILLFLSLFTRASSAAFIIATFVYLIIKDRRQFIVTAVTAFPLLLIFLGWSRHEFGEWIPAYYSFSRFQTPRWSIWVAIYGHLFSASRGIFVFSPFLLLIIPGFLLTWRRIIRRPIVLQCLIWILTLLYLSSRAVAWWGGGSYGPRLLTELILAFSLLFALMWREVIETLRPEFQKILIALFLFLGAIAIFIHSYQGLYNVNTGGWNVYIEAEALPPLTGLGDLFDWSNPQFLATGEGLCSFRSERMLLLLEYDTTLANYRIGDVIWYNGDSILDFKAAAFLTASLEGLPTTSANNAGTQSSNHPSLRPRVFLPMIETYGNNAVFIGWSSVKEYLSYRWSDCRRVKVVFRLADEIPEGASFALAITAGSNGVQRTEVSLNESRLGEWTFASSETEPEMAVFKFDGDILRPNESNTIAFDIPDASPVNASEWRLFGLALSHLSIYPDDMPTPMPLSTRQPTSYP